MKKLAALLWIGLLIVSLLSPHPVKAQSSGEYWAKTYGGSREDVVTDIRVLPNGDLIAVGYTTSSGAGSYDAFVMKLSPDGKVLWAKTYGGSGDDWAYCLALTPDGDIIVTGVTGSFGIGYGDVWVLRLDSNGNVIWQKTYGGNKDDGANAVVVASNGDIIIAGWTRSFGAGGKDVWVLRLDSNGNVIWQKTYGGKWNDYANALALAPNGDIIVVGYTESFGIGTPDYSNVWVLRLDSNGNVIWQKTYGGNKDDGANAVVVASNGDIIIAGYTESFGAGNGDIWVLRLDENGNVKWQKTYGGSEWDKARAVALTPNGDIVVAGYTWSFGGGWRDIWILELKSYSNIIWQKTYGGKYWDEANTLRVLPDDTILVGGDTGSFGNGVYDAWILQLPSSGNLKLCEFCHESNALVSDSNAQINNSNATVQNSRAQMEYSEATVYEWKVSTKVQYSCSSNLKVSSSPSGAKVYVNRSYKGVTPLTLELSPGVYTIKLTKNNYEDYIKTIKVYPNKTTDIWVSLTPISSTLSVFSSPSGAMVYVNGYYKGITPLTMNLSPGTYSIKFIMDGYDTYTTNVTLSAGESGSISATLKPAYGYIDIKSYPPSAKVYVDGNYVGKTPVSDYKLSPGQHEVKITLNGYRDYVKTITVTAGEKTSLSASLTPLPSSTSTSSSSMTSTSSTSSAVVSTSSPSSTVTPVAQTSGGLNYAYVLIALVGLAVIGGLAAKTRSGKPKSRPSGGVEPAPAPAPSRKPETGPKAPPKTVPGFPPELLDKYEPLEFLGEGGFAKVFKVKRKSDGKTIALKVSRLDEKAKRFFLKEVKAWRLLDHPNIVKLYAAYAEPLPHLELEFVDGIQLNGEVIRDLGKYPKPVEEEEALHFIRGIAQGLAHAHSKQVYHRDLKPQNVLITSNLTPKITDWGLAKVGAVSTTATTTKGLTLLYAAPEQLDDETYGHTDQRTDIYQLGLIFYELLTGKLPYMGTSPAVVMAKVINPAVKPKPPSHYNKALAKYDGIFERLLAKNKEDRYQSVEEFLEDLELMKKLGEERKRLQEEIEKTKTTMSMTTDSKELKKLMRQLVEQLSRNALLHARLNDKAGLVNALEDLKDFSKEHRSELENAIAQFEVMMRESVPISKSTLDELRVLLHKIQREVE